MSWQILAADVSSVWLGIGDDPQLAAGLDGKGLFDPLEAGGDRFQLFHPFDVAFERFAAGAGARGAAGVGRGHEHRVGMIERECRRDGPVRHGRLRALRRSA